MPASAPGSTASPPRAVSPLAADHRHSHGDPAVGVAFVFMERHYNTVTRRLSAAVSQDIAAVVDMYATYPSDKDAANLRRIAGNPWNCRWTCCRPIPCRHRGRVRSSPFSTAPCRGRSAVGSSSPIGSTPWAARTSSRCGLKMPDAVLRIFARRSSAYASNSHIFLLWDGGHLSGAAGRSDPVPAQPDPPRSKTWPMRRKPSARARCGELPPAAPASTARGGGLPGNEAAHRAPDRAAHRHAGGGLARHAHHPHPLQARTGFLPEGPEVDELRRDVDELQGCWKPIWPLPAAMAASQTALTDMAQLGRICAPAPSAPVAQATASFMGRRWCR